MYSDERDNKHTAQILYFKNAITFQLAVVGHHKLKYNKTTSIFKEIIRYKMTSNRQTD